MRVPIPGPQGPPGNLPDAASKGCSVAYSDIDQDSGGNRDFEIVYNSSFKFACGQYGSADGIYSNFRQTIKPPPCRGEIASEDSCGDKRGPFGLSRRARATFLARKRVP